MLQAIKINTLKLAAEETLWPTRCVICDTPGFLLCPKCAKTLSYIDHSKTCQKCGEPFGRLQCATCMSKPPFDGCVSATLLDKNSGAIVTLFKDAGEIRLAKVMAYFIAKALKPNWYKGSCLVTFIPASKEAFNKRGFDHSEILANEVSKQIGQRCVKLFKRPNSKDQRNLGRKGRFANIGQKYKILESKKDFISRLDLPVLIIDDVFTTGSTIYSASRELRSLGINPIYGGVFSRTF